MRRLAQPLCLLFAPMADHLESVILQAERGNAVSEARVPAKPVTGFHVVHVITDLDVGGAEQTLSQVAAAMARCPNAAVVVSLLPGGVFAERLRADGVEVIELAFRRPLGALSGIVRLARLIARSKPDIVQGWMYHGDLVALIALFLSGRRSRTRLIWGIRCSNIDFKQYEPGLRWVVRACALLSRRPDVVTANSEAGMEVHRALGYWPRHAVVIDNGIDTDRFCPDARARIAVRRELSIDDNATVLALVARVDAMKDHGSFLAAMADLPNLQALLIGGRTERLAAPPNVRALGRRSDVARLLAGCDFIVSSSAFGEGFSNAIAEGMACGLPAIATNVGAARHIIGETGIVVPPRDVRALADGLRRLAAEPADQRAKRAGQARARIIEHFSLPVAVDRWTDCYRSALAARFEFT